MPSAPNAYLKTKIMTASPAELRLMLIEGAVRFARKALEGLLEKNYEEVYAGVTRTQDILMELINALKPEHAPDLCARLSGLYTYMYTQLMRASSERDPDKVREVIKLLEFERETWTLAMRQLATGCEPATAPAEATAAATAPAPALATEPKRPSFSSANGASRHGHGLAGSMIGSTVSLQG